MSTIIQNKRGTASQWTSLNPVLYAGEFGWESDTNRFKIGDGTTAWNTLPYASPALAQGIPSGGTAGQLLTKNSSTNYDAIWADQGPAPSTSVVKHLVKLGESISKGQAVYVSSANGTNMIVSKASNASEATSSKTMGLLETGGSTNAEVNVVVEGLLSGLDTSTANAAGDPVWLGTSGNLIYGLTNKPYAPAHLVFIGIVTRVNQNNGEIFIKPQNGFELQELHNVGIGYTSTPSDKDLLVYENSTSLWKNKSFSTLDLLTATTAASTYAPLASPTFTGTPAAPTATAGTNTTQLATTAFVSTAISNLINAAPSALDTLNELAAAINNDSSFASTVTTALSGKQPLDADLTAIAALSTTGLAKRTASDTWSLITDNSTNWDTAYGWGNHASAGYLTTSSAASTYVSLTGTYSNPSWITGLAWSKISSTPTTLSGYGITDAASSTHTHGNITNGGAIGSTSGLMVKTTTSGLLTTLAAGTAGQFLQYDGTWATPAGTYTLPTANSTTLGGIKLFSDTAQSVAANSISATASRTYGAQLNASNQLVVNVPWTDTVYSAPTIGSTSITSGGTFTTLPGVTSINGATVPSSGTLAINPTTTKGDLIYASATGTPGTLARLGIPSTDGWVVTYNSTTGVPEWRAASGGSYTAPTLAGTTLTSGGTITTLSGTLTADQFAAANNGNGTNFKVGDDVWIGDINIANTMSVKGQQSSTNGFIRFGGDSNGFGYDGTKLTYGGTFTLTGALNLAAGTTSLSPLTFQSGTNLTTITSGANEYDGTVFYKTSNTNPGRALATQNYYYASNGGWTPDFTASTTAQSFLGSATNGITLAAGTTYEFDFYATTRFQILNTATAASGAYSIVSSGTATVGIVQIIEYGNNTTSIATATTLSAVQTNNAVTFSPSTSTGSRYSFLKARGIIRVTGSGTAKIYPALTPSALMTNSDPNYSIWTVSSAVFKLTPIGNGTVTTVGAFA